MPVPPEQDRPTGDPALGGVPIDEEPMEVEAPRRAASAEFVVDAQVGSEAAIREAMDPANQSLADALRLSFRVLQVVILVLVAMFFVSGFTIVEERQSGVMLRFGKIVKVGGEEALEPGRSWNVLPYPAGDFVVFDVENRSVDLRQTFWPGIPPNVTLEDAIDRAQTSAALQPGRDGYVLTRDGDLAHLKLTGEYAISDPVQFVERVGLQDADRLVELALQRAVVQAAAGLTLQELVDLSEDTKALIHDGAQRVLDSLRSGIDLVEVQLPETRPPLAIVKAYGDLQNAREEARERVESARKDAEQTLIDIAGPSYRELARLIDRYEEAEELGGEQARTLLAQINEFLASDRARGGLAAIIERARAYESVIESTLGNEVRRFKSVLPGYREHPALETKQRWLEAYTSVLSGEDVEIFYVPKDVGSIDLRISSDEDIQKLRQQLKLNRKEQAALRESLTGWRRYVQRARDFEPGKARPLLEPTPEGTVRPKGGRR
ncbi:MAG: SPFH domain-containing protein [Planctomycetota bacterium]|jgi:membrane protease subunit HflK